MGGDIDRGEIKAHERRTDNEEKKTSHKEEKKKI